MREVSLSSNWVFTEFKFSSWQIWIKAPSVTAPDSPDIIECSPKKYIFYISVIFGAQIQILSYLLVRSQIHNLPKLYR